MLASSTIFNTTILKNIKYGNHKTASYFMGSNTKYLEYLCELN